MSRLDDIQARLDAATPGPWWWRNTTEPYLQGARTRIVMAFRRMGTQGAQPQFRDEHGLLVDAGKENINDFPDAALIANAPGDLAELVTFARAMEGLHRPHKVICLNPSHSSDCDAMVCDACDTPWPCPTAKALDQIGGAS